MDIDWLQKRAQIDPQKVAVIDSLTDRKWTFTDLNQRARKLAAYLQQHGVGVGDRVALFAKNDISHLDLFFATSKIGAIFVPLNWRLSLMELNDILSDCDPTIIFYDESLRVKEEVVYIGDKYQLQDVHQVAYEDVFSQKEFAHLKVNYVKKDEPAVMIYTSGTTGAPKGTLLSHSGIIHNAFFTISNWKLTAQDSTITIGPMFHSAGLFCFTVPLLLVGGTVILQPTYEAQLTTENMSKYRPTRVFMVPTMYYDLWQRGMIDYEALSSVKQLISGGAPPSQKVEQAFEEKGLYIQNSYGITEIGPNNFNKSKTTVTNKPTSVGKPFMFAKVRLIGDDGVEVKQGEVGELQIAGEHGFIGYWNNTKASLESFAGEYVRTGDLAYEDEDGDYFIVDRKKDMIITGGENVFPSEVENVLHAHPAVRNVCVVPFPNDRWGESVAAAVILKDKCPRETTELVKDLSDYALRFLTKYKIPKFYYFTKEFPLNGTGKINKRALKKVVTSQIKDGTLQHI